MFFSPLQIGLDVIQISLPLECTEDEVKNLQNAKCIIKLQIFFSRFPIFHFVAKIKMLSVRDLSSGWLTVGWTLIGERQLVKSVLS